MTKCDDTIRRSSVPTMRRCQTAPVRAASMKRDPHEDSLPEDEALLGGFRPSEQRAILEFCHLLGKDPRVAADLAEAIRAWESGLGRLWRRQKMSRDYQTQMSEIERHKYLVSERVGHDIGWDRAAHDWIDKHAAAWRDWWENQPDSEPG